MPTLVFEIEDGSRIMAPLEGRTAIGSAEGNDVVADREDIAPHHAEVFTGLDNAWWVRDKDSAAGTFVNGIRVTTRRLSPGDLLLFGSISARFSMDSHVIETGKPSEPAPAAMDREIEKKRLELSRLGEALTKARAEFEKTVREQEARLVALRNESARLEPAMGDKRKALSGLDAELAKAMAGLEKATRDEQERINALRSEAAKLEPAVEGKRQEISKLHSGLAEARAGFEKGVKEQEKLLGGLREQTAKLEAAIGSRREDLSKLDTALAQARAGYEKSLAEQDGLLNAARTEAAQLETAVASRKQELSVLGAALANAQAERERAAKAQESRVAELQEHASGLESDIGSKKQELAGLAGALQEAGKIVEESRSLATGLHENRKKHEELSKSVAEAAGRHEVISHQVRTLSDQQRTKLVEMERLERDLADLEARSSAAAGALEEHEAGRQRAEASLKRTTLLCEEADAELTKLTGEKNRLTEDVHQLGEQRGSLGLEIAALETRKGEMRGVLDGLDKLHGEAAKKLDSAAEELRSTTTRHGRLLADIEEAAAHHAQLQAEAGQAAAQIRIAQSEVESHVSTRENLMALNEQLQAEVATVGNRLAELSGAEERLQESRTELHRTEAAHLSLTNVLGELTRRHDAVERSTQELESRIAALKETQRSLEEAIPALKSSHDGAQLELASFRSEAEESRRVLTDEIARLRAVATDEEARLGHFLQEVGQAQRRQTELEQQNRELEAASQRLGETQAQFRSAELERDNAEARARVLAQACSNSQLRLSELESAEKSAGLRVSRLTMQESDLEKSVKRLGEEQLRERRRAEELRGLSDDAEREGVREKERLAADIAELHSEVARLETRLAHARSWNAELDQLYEKLGKMPDASPEAREAWLEIQRRKKDISDQLPSGIQVRPQSRPTVVPRGR